MIKNTELLYMSNMALLSCKARILTIKKEEERTIVILDRTVFYPQGGGQPSDQGVIASKSGRMIVEKVIFDGETVKHCGTIEGDIIKDQEVQCEINEKRRELHSKIHSAGHVIDMALEKLNLSWVPKKGFHFPEGPYIEYSGSFIFEQKDEVIQKIEKCANDLLPGVYTSVLFMDKKDMKSICANVPDYLPENRPSRVIMYGDSGVPCGGTHVKKLSDIGTIQIRKLKQKKGVVKISYQIIN